MDYFRNGNGRLLATATFCCSICGESAATIELRVDDVEENGGPSSNLSSKVVMVGFLWGSATWTENEGMIKSLEKILTAANVRALYNVNEEWAPFYCPECDRIYCRNHWFVNLEFDDDFPGWYDCAHGTCPKGHERIIDD